MNKFIIGQVLLILIPGEMVLHPVMIVEEVNRKTLTGEETTYTIELSVNGKRSRVPLDDEVLTFTSIAEAQMHLLENARIAINRICETAQAFSEKEFPQNMSEQTNSSVKHLQAPGNSKPDESQQHYTISLPNGKTAKVKMPATLE